MGSIRPAVICQALHLQVRLVLVGAVEVWSEGGDSRRDFKAAATEGRDVREDGGAGGGAGDLVAQEAMAVDLSRVVEGGKARDFVVDAVGCMDDRSLASIRRPRQADSRGDIPIVISDTPRESVGSLFVEGRKEDDLVARADVGYQALGKANLILRKEVEEIDGEADG